MTSTGMQQMKQRMDTAVPTLKVMRLQKPELHIPAAGTLEDKAILSSAMCLPDSFGVIHIGEKFTAYLGALNVSKTLPVSRLTVSAQLQTPSQRWHLASSLDSGNLKGGVDVPPEAGIDAIVSHVLEEPGQHILRVEVGYGSADGQKTLRKFYRFQVSIPLLINVSTHKNDESTCFVSLDVQNNGTETKGGLTICSVEFDSLQGLEAKQVQIASQGDDSLKATTLFDNCGRLEAEATRSYLFRVDATAGKAGKIQAGDELGTASFTWRKACGEMGRMKSSLLICPKSPNMLGTENSTTRVGEKGKPLPLDTPSAALMPGMSQDRQPTPGQRPHVTVEPIDPPAKVQIGQPFHIEFLVANHSEKYLTMQLQFQMGQAIGISVCGPSFKNLDEVPGNGGSVRVSMRFIALTAGLLQLRGCYVADLSTGVAIPQPPLCNTLAVTKS